MIDKMIAMYEKDIALLKDIIKRHETRIKEIEHKNEWMNDRVDRLTENNYY